MKLDPEEVRILAMRFDAARSVITGTLAATQSAIADGELEQVATLVDFIEQCGSGLFDYMFGVLSQGPNPNIDPQASALAAFVRIGTQMDYMPYEERVPAAAYMAVVAADGDMDVAEDLLQKAGALNADS